MDKKLKKIVEPALVNLAERIKRIHLALSRKSTDDTLKSLRVEEDGDSLMIRGEDYFAEVSDQLKMNKKPLNFEQIVERWVDEKGIKVMLKPYVKQLSEKWSPSLSPYQRGLKKLADLTALKIAEEGTSLEQLQENDQVEKEVSKTMEKIQDDVATFYLQEITNSL